MSYTTITDNTIQNEENEYSPDTLVLKLVERDELTFVKDNTIYLIYDTKNRHYIIRGQRRGNHYAAPFYYSFDCQEPEDLADFIEYMLDTHHNKISHIMYNYDNLPASSSEITYDFLKENDSIHYEMSGYDNGRLKRTTLVKILNLLKNVSNCY